MKRSKMRRATRHLLERLSRGAIESVSFGEPGLRDARRAGYVVSIRAGAGFARLAPGAHNRRRDFRKLAWRHRLTDTGRAALAELACP
jgi:hypothetical protein